MGELGKDWLRGVGVTVPTSPHFMRPVSVNHSPPHLFIPLSRCCVRATECHASDLCAMLLCDCRCPKPSRTGHCTWSPSGFRANPSRDATPSHHCHVLLAAFA
jgi:hypothetical protein